jgi:hypothetical protein
LYKAKQKTRHSPHNSSTTGFLEEAWIDPFEK